MDYAKVSCIMPTHMRRGFLSNAITLFLAQTYPNKELVILDSRDSSDLIPSHPDIRYMVSKEYPLGRRRNILCEEARGDIILHWDDDDWHAPDRIDKQVGALLESGRSLCGLQTLLFFHPLDQRAWIYRYPGSFPWLGGSTLCYTRNLWKQSPFRDIQIGEDFHFVRSCSVLEDFLVMDDFQFHVGRLHPANTSPKRVNDASWRPIRIEELPGGCQFNMVSTRN